MRDYTLCAEWIETLQCYRLYYFARPDWAVAFVRKEDMKKAEEDYFIEYVTD